MIVVIVKFISFTIKIVFIQFQFQALCIIIALVSNQSQECDIKERDLIEFK